MEAKTLTSFVKRPRLRPPYLAIPPTQAVELAKSRSVKIAYR